MNDLKDFLTSSTTLPGANKEFNDRMKQINDQFVGDAPVLRDLMANVQQGKPVELEIRSFKVAMPPSFWRTFEAFAEVFDKRVEYGIHDPNDPADVIQDNVAKVFRENANIINSQNVVLSQMVMDAMLSFVGTMAKGKFLEGLEKVIATGDPEQLINYLKSQGDAVEFTDDDSDDDSED